MIYRDSATLGSMLTTKLIPEQGNLARRAGDPALSQAARDQKDAGMTDVEPADTLRRRSVPGLTLHKTLDRRSIDLKPSPRKPRKEPLLRVLLRSLDQMFG